MIRDGSAQCLASARLGAVSKMGQSNIRKLLIVGAMSVIQWVVRKGGSANPWLDNKMARMIRAMTTK